MEHRLAQKRMLTCAAFFSFGILSGALTSLRLSANAMSQLADRVLSVCSTKPLLMIPAFAALAPVLIMIFGVSAAGSALIDLVLSVFGFAAGLTFLCSVRLGCHPPIAFGFLLIYTLCVVVIGGDIGRISFLMRVQLKAGGLSRPDYGYAFLRIGSTFFLLLLAAAALAYYYLSS